MGRSTKGWFYGIKLHAIIDRKGNLMNVMFAKGNIHDTSIVEEIAGFFKGLLIGDKGYFSKTLFQNLSQKRSYANYRNSTEYEECFDGNL